MAIDPAFLRAHREASTRVATSSRRSRKLRNHGSSSIKYGRGAVLTVDLTNRCNMMCDPCFMDANQVGYVHELEWDEIQKILDDALTDPAAPPDEHPVLGRRADALARTSSAPIEYARDDRLSSPCSARRTASASRRSPSSRSEAKEAGLRMAYLQFDGVDERGERAPQGRQPLRREAPRDREPPRGGHRRHPRRHGRQRREQRSGRPDRRVRDRERRQGHGRELPAGELHRPRRGHHRRASATRSATR